MNNNDLGEVEDIDYGDLIDTMKDADESTDEEVSHKESLNLEEHNPTFSSTVETVSPAGTRCKTCGNKLQSPLTTIDGECVSCAKRRLRNLETKLVSIKAVKPKRKYCIMPDHPEAVQDQFHPDWNKITVFGVDFYPPAELCPKCMLILRTYFTEFLESRGILRAAQSHHDNQWLPATHKLTTKEYLESVAIFQEFLLGAEVFCRDSDESMSNLLKEMKDSTERIMRKEAKAAWQKKKDLKAKKKELYPILQEDYAVQKEYQQKPPTDVLQLISEELLSSIMRWSMTHKLILSPEEDEDEKQKFLQTMQTNDFLNQMYNQYPVLMFHLRKEAELALGNHASYVDDVLVMALRAYENFLST